MVYELDGQLTASQVHRLSLGQQGGGIGLREGMRNDGDRREKGGREGIDGYERERQRKVAGGRRMKGDVVLGIFQTRILHIRKQYNISEDLYYTPPQHEIWRGKENLLHTPISDFILSEIFSTCLS